MAKRICVFLLLGVLLFSIVLSGCSHKEETEDSENETGLKNVAFHELVKIDRIGRITVFNDQDEVIFVAKDQTEIVDFVNNFESLLFSSIGKILHTAESAAVKETEECVAARKRINTAYQIDVQGGDDYQVTFFIGLNGNVYFISETGNCYVSDKTTDYLSEIMLLDK